MDDEVKAPLESPVEESLGASVGTEEGERVLHDDSRPYSCFSQRQKTCISSIASFSAMFSGLSSFIYYPSITAISRSLHVSVQLINLTITSYQVVSGIAPSILGDLADQIGRRPVCLIAFTLYFSANVGLALQNSYTALVVLRCLQSAGASSTIAIAYGFIADIAPPAERGSYVGILQGFTNSAPSLGPILGGVLTENISWHWIFWLLAIMSGTNLLVLGLIMPETSRRIVNDGSLRPSHLINRSLFPNPKPSAYHRSDAELAPKRTIRFPNPLNCLIILWQRASFLVILVGGIQYTVYGCLAASFSTLMIRLYSLNYLTGGLIYLPCGIGGVLAAYTTGKLLDRDYIRTAKRYNLRVDKSTNDLSNFPIEQARLLSVFPLLAISTTATVGFGWALNQHTSIAVPLILTFFSGASQVAIFTVCGTLLTDLNPNQSATVQAGYNLIRCALSAGGIAGLQALIDAIGVGWCFTIYAIIGALCIPIFVLLRTHGMLWRTGSRGPHRCAARTEEISQDFRIRGTISGK
ncbi:MAG: hypothetical protein ALECFALPRED_008623 [Alectoria fallacina]|uniref:Major facilitator superfamily (MFS) profile domain-containing protein n=1 Tax=Alectoria fallacina TaxID=1903189 RepID=A0A8H3I2Z5_9LECA|nr:MAG: hypothetical protein ALECFALPRED_008623 [Alectoria fallacina]